ncbi:2-iminoacetate synthase [Desulfobaculum xiamenense]|uniref:2-iminoacetate synthase n=1 Tax=Desulfobaculum xiamenense TaxID=995050 RepID=A0A846QJK5_9BACT|nr:2-iminoacetate synthase ThiH [Desulfobaculum xiamenense]NJB68408.1 2-iminoacetate synthase [Desulfobaculum xiamenense]
MTGFPELCATTMDRDLASFFARVTPDDVRRAMARSMPSADDFLTLLSPAAQGLLEEMAQRAHELTVRHFGRTMQIFTPLYLSNHCTNRCVYCGFNAGTGVARKRLTMDEVRAEGETIAASGQRQLLILTGDAPALAGVDYLERCTKILRGMFPSVTMEVFAMTEAEYARLAAAGIDGLTMFQETYDPVLYERLHPAGPKRDYAFRLGAPERGCRAGMRVVNVGALLGLSPDWRREAFLTGLHADYLQRHYPNTDVAISLPRMRPHAGHFQPATAVTDANLVQILLAQRIFLPFAGITISTREAPAFRDNIVPLGVTRMSAGVSTAVGGHASDDNADTVQFEISDHRGLAEFSTMLRSRGYQPVYKDWEPNAHVAGNRP